LKSAVYFIYLFLLSISLYGQETRTLIFAGVNRQFLLYVPDIYEDEGQKVPLLFSLHGLGDNMNNFSNAGFHQIADTANFIVITPQALTDSNALLALAGPAWNSGATMFGLSPNAGVDDVGFLLAIKDEISEEFEIDTTRIYSTGFSMGAYMTNRLACETDAVFAAIAPVAGTIGVNLICDPSDKIPVCEFHGTADSVVGYTDNQSGTNVAEYITIWSENKECLDEPVITALPDLANDGFTVDHLKYANAHGEIMLEHFRVNSADHDWLYENNDISYPVEIWHFLSRYSLQEEEDTIIQVSSAIASVAGEQWAIFPNPVHNEIRIRMPQTLQADYRIATINGLWMGSYNGVANNQPIDVSALPAGYYFLSARTPDSFMVKPFIKL